jgi:molybdenum storage protein
VISSGGGIRSRHAYFIGTDLGMPTGVLAQLTLSDTLGKALHSRHAAGIATGGRRPPGYVDPHAAVLRSGGPGHHLQREPPFSLWEHLPRFGRIPPHRADAGSYLLAECFGAANLTLIKDVDGLYEQDPKTHPGAGFIKDITVAELEKRNLPTLPFDRVLIELLACARLCKRFQIINGLKPELLEPALRGEHVGTIVRMDESS